MKLGIIYKYQPWKNCAIHDNDEYLVENDIHSLFECRKITVIKQVELDSETVRKMSKLVSHGHTSYESSEVWTCFDVKSMSIIYV